MSAEKSRNPLVVLVFILFAIGISLLIVHWGNQKDQEVAVEEPLTVDEVFQCHENSECIIVTAGCCDCNAGGRSIAINARYQDYWQNRWVEQCADTMCASVISKDPSCTAEPVCFEGLCQLK